MSANAADWRTLTDAQRAGWTSLGESMTRSDALGQVYTLTGFQAFCSVNGNLLNIGGTVLTTAPALVTPAALTSASVTTTAGTLSLIFAASPLDAGAKLLVFAGPGRSAGRGFEGDYRLVHVSAAAQATPANILSDYTVKYGVPVVGLKIFFSIQVSIGGFVSGPIIISKVVAA
jgi:hypothetical protein